MNTGNEGLYGFFPKEPSLGLACVCFATGNTETTPEPPDKTTGARSGTHFSTDEMRRLWVHDTLALKTLCSK